MTLPNLLLRTASATLSRRRLLATAAAWAGGAAAALAETQDSGGARTNFKSRFQEGGEEATPPATAPAPAPAPDTPPGQPPESPWNSLFGPQEEEYYDPDLLPPPEAEIDYPIEPVDPKLIKKKFRRQTVPYDGPEPAGTVVVDPRSHFLYFVIGDGTAIRYGVGVGRAGFAWAGDAEIRMKRRWPRWVPPREMVDRDERAREWRNGMPGGPDNPLGARALYLFANNQDTLYRIHGTNEPQSIGQSVSSGCIRMLNEDVADLFDQVKIGTPVVVRA
jgi:lipoprotein-anchoring transpeptidase ErfK/SrfK